MAKRRVGEIALNFDSITDLITNLAGGLILIVLLNHGLTQKAAMSARTLPGSGTRPTPVDKPAAPRAAALQQNVDELNRLLLLLEEQLRAERAKADELRKEAASRRPKAEEDPQAKPGEPGVVELRPPMEVATLKKVGLSCILSDRKVYCLDDTEAKSVIEATLREINTAIAAKGDLKPYEGGLIKPLKAGSCDLRFRLVKGQRLELEIAAVPGAAKGETFERASDPASDFASRLGGLDPELYYVNFAVYSGSFETFRSLRDRLAGDGFNYNWIPFNAKQALILSTSGSGIHMIQ